MPSATPGAKIAARRRRNNAAQIYSEILDEQPRLKSMLKDGQRAKRGCGTSYGTSLNWLSVTTRSCGSLTPFTRY